MLRKRRNLFLLGAVVTGMLLAAVGFYLFRYSPTFHAMLQESSPLVRFHTPGHGQEVVVGATVTVEVEAVAPGGRIQLLQLWADGVLVGEVSASSAATAHAWAWVPMTPGDHTLVARAFNKGGTPGLAAVRVRAVQATDSDWDGLADEVDMCPQRTGSMSFNGCPPGMPNGVAADPEVQTLSTRWVPPQVSGGALGEQVALGPGESVVGGEVPPEGSAPAEGAAAPAEEGGPSPGAQPEERAEEGVAPEAEGREAGPGGAGEEGGLLGGLGRWFGPGGALDRFCPVCRDIRDRIFGTREAAGIPSPERYMPPGPNSVGLNNPLEEFVGSKWRQVGGGGIALQVEVMEARTAVQWAGVYCYIRLGEGDWERVPGGSAALRPKRPGFWNVDDYLSGPNAALVSVRTGALLTVEMECLGQLADPRAEPIRLGQLRREHGPEDWNGEPIVARGEADGNWFEITYRICNGPCDQDQIPAPFGLRLQSEQRGGRRIYHLTWYWRGNWEEIDGFNVYVCYPGTGNCFQLDSTTWTSLVLDSHYAVPECGRMHRFHVRAYRYVWPEEEGGLRTIVESPPSPPLWVAGPVACSGPNRLAIQETFGPTRDQARMRVRIAHHYVGDHGDQVTVFAYPLKDGEPDPSFFWTSYTISGSAEDGEGAVSIFYAGTELHTTDGLRLTMVSEDGEIFYERDVVYPVQWFPSYPDLTIPYVTVAVRRPEAPAGYAMSISVVNRGDAPVWSWDGALRIVTGDGRTIPVMGPQGFLGPWQYRNVLVPWWDEDITDDLSPSYQVVVDPYNRVAELDETNNVYVGTPLRVRVVWDKMTAYHDPDLVEGFMGLEGRLTARVGAYFHTIEFDGAAHEDWCNSPVGPEYRPYEIGLGILPSQVYDFGDKIFPAITQFETCLALGEEDPFFITQSAWCPETDRHEVQCELLAEQGFAPETDWVEVPVWPHRNLVLQATLYDIDYEYQWWPPTAREEHELVCTVRREITWEELANLPLEVTLGSPEEGCEITVQIQPVP